MGSKFCCLWPQISGQKSKSPGARDGSITGSSFKIENHRRWSKIFKRKIEMETPEKNIPMARKLALEDLMRGELCACKQTKKKVHPYSSHIRGSLIGEAKDSLCLDRPMNHHEEGERMSSCSLITRSLSGTSQKRVSFKLPHTVIFYSPEEQKPYGFEEDSFSSIMGPNCREDSFDSAEEPFLRLAVDTLPHIIVSSKI